MPQPNCFACGHKTLEQARRAQEDVNMTKVLIALTGATEWSLKDGSKHFGGVWSPEFVFPHDSFTKAGYEVVVATLGGVPAIVDPTSLSLGLQENDPASVDFQRSYLRRPEIVATLARPRHTGSRGRLSGQSAAAYPRCLAHAPKMGRGPLPASR
jgi:hypothetical protein